MRLRGLECGINLTSFLHGGFERGLPGLDLVRERDDLLFQIFRFGLVGRFRERLVVRHIGPALLGQPGMPDRPPLVILGMIGVRVANVGIRHPDMTVARLSMALACFAVGVEGRNVVRSRSRHERFPASLVGVRARAVSGLA